MVRRGNIIWKNLQYNKKQLYIKRIFAFFMLFGAWILLAVPSVSYR